MKSTKAVLQNNIAEAVSDEILDYIPAISQEDEAQERIYLASLQLLYWYQRLIATESYAPSIYATAHDLGLTADDVRFLQDFHRNVLSLRGRK